MLTIRPANPQDAPLILNFIKELAAYEKLLHEVVTTPEMLHESLFGAQARGAETLIAEENGVAVGFALFFHNFSTFLGKSGIYLEDLYVQPQHRGKGYGKALLDAVKSIAQQRNCGRLEWSVLDWNTPAIAFYQKYGATAMGEWTVFRKVL
jgi:GNAT superfamily N-acetyltransferase